MSCKIYLAGFINGVKLKECMEWRKKLRTEYASKGWDICWLDPLNGKEVDTGGEEVITSITPDGLKSNVPPEAIFDRDLMSVKSSDLLVVNLDTFGESRVPLGTISELAWAGLLRKPIILISKEPTFTEHPFIKRMVSWIVPDVDTLIKDKIINYFYKGIVSAVY